METQNEVLKTLLMVYRRKGLFLLVALAVTASVVAYSYTLPRMYRADSTVFIERSIISELIRGLAVSPDMEERIRVLSQAMLSRELISRVLDQVDSAPVLFNESQRQEYISGLQRRTSINVQGRGDLFRLSLTDSNPVFARDFINTLVGTYVEENISAKREETYGASRFLDEQLALFKVRLDRAEDAIIQFRRQHNVFLGEDERSKVADMRDYNRQVEQLELELSTLNARKQSLERQLRTIQPEIALFSAQRQQDSIAMLQDRLSRLLLTYTENYPEVIRLRGEIAALQTLQEQGGMESAPTETRGVNPVYQETLQAKLSLEAEIGSVHARMAKLREMIQALEVGLREVPEHQKELDRLIQERDSARNIYDQLLLRLGQSEVSRQMEIGDKATTFRIVDPAILPRVPVSPNMLQMILMAVAAGLGGGAGLVILLEKQNPTVKSVEELKNYGVRILAQIPSIPDPQTLRRRRLKDRLCYALAGGYGLMVVALLAYETLIN